MYISAKTIMPAQLPGEEPIIVVGAGPAGVRTVQEALSRASGWPVLLFGDEGHDPYNRVQLTSVLTGELRLREIYFPEMVPPGGSVIQQTDCRIVAIDRGARTVTDHHGRVYPYARLVLATGSRPFLPPVPGIDLSGVCTFHSLKDTERLLACAAGRDRVVILGGGLLGLEAAHGLLRRTATVTVVQHGPRLMPRQLDDAASALLAAHIGARGADVILGERVERIQGDRAVQGILLASGRTIPCDVVVVCAGIRPNTELALKAGLSVGTGIQVDDGMRTSDPLIYAIGDCAEHRGRTYGLVAPAWEQAAVAVGNIVGDHACYTGSVSATRLKVAGLSVYSIGATADSDRQSKCRTLVHARPEEGIYKKLVFQRGRLVGAIAVGPWAALGRVQDSVTSGRRLWPWQSLRFRLTGEPWPERATASVLDWPAAAVVCNCTGVTRGTLATAIAAGCDRLEALQQRTGAGTVCGSCRPLLLDLLGAPAAVAMSGAYLLMALSMVVLLIAMATALLGPFPYRTSVQASLQFDHLWTDGTLKQVTGFALLAFLVLALGLSLRKRWRRLSLGNFSTWRVAHVVLGLGALVVLDAHTGLHLGERLNFLLMTSFIALMMAGAASGGIMALEHRLSAVAGRRLRRAVTWLHVVALWPMPVLIAFHVLASYYF